MNFKKFILKTVRVYLFYFIYLLNIYTGRIYNISIECKFSYKRIYKYIHTSVKSTAINVFPVK